MRFKNNVFISGKITNLESQLLVAKEEIETLENMVQEVSAGTQDRNPGVPPGEISRLQARITSLTNEGESLKSEVGFIYNVSKIKTYPNVCISELYIYIS